MKFRFCGELDAPDWLLKEITILSKISAVKVRLIVPQVVNELLGTSIDWDKISKLVKDANLERSDVKAAIAALNFIISNSAKYNVDDATLSNELRQLGLPKEHCDALAKPYRDNIEKLREIFSQQTLKLTRLQSTEWRVDYLLSSSALQDLNAPTIQLKLTTVSDAAGKISNEQHTVELTPDKLRVLLNELRSAKESMDGIS